MSSILVGMFDTEMAANQARTKLLAAGFPASAVSMTGGTSSSATSASTSSLGSSAGSTEPQHEGAIARFFDNLFGGGSGETSVSDGYGQGYGETYQEAFRRGSYRVTVTTSSEAEIDEAENILNAAGAVDIDEKAQSWRAEGWSGGAAGVLPGAMGATGMASTGGTTVDAGATQKLEELEEELQVGKRVVARGGVRIFSRMTVVPVEESVRLREEHAQVQRRVVDRPATEADFAAFKDGSIEVREMGEEVVVSKTARVVGEVEIGKTATEHDETVRDTVRRTQVDVEQIPGTGASSSARDTATTDSTTDATTDMGVSMGGSSPIRAASSGAVGGRPIGPGAGSVAGRLSGQEISETDNPANDADKRI